MAKINSKFHDPVPAGTVVRLNVPSPDPGFAYDWYVIGPFSNSQPERFPDRGPHFDFDTSGRRAGDYDVTAVERSRDKGTDAPPPGPDESAPADEPFDLDAPYGIGGRRRPDDELPEPVRDFARAVDGEHGHERSWEDSERTFEPFTVRVAPAAPAAGAEGVMPVSLQRTAMVPTSDQILWVVIRNRTNAVSFRQYKKFVDGVMDETPVFRGTHAYEVLKEATDQFLMHEFGVLDDDVASLEDTLSEERGRVGRSLTAGDVESMRRAYYEELPNGNGTVLPYLGIIRDRLSELPVKSAGEVGGTYGILPSRIGGPLAIELIWSYWHEEGMLVQALNSILARFQNRRLTTGPDPLSRFDLDPLRPLSNLFWGWAQDEMRRLTVRRRSYEYEHEYGLRLIGRAVPADLPADRRSKFLEAFHNLLFLAHVFFKEDDDTTVLADGFPLLNALRETHLILAEGAHNQFGDLPSVARAEMLMMQWLLARPEMREFLGGRIMVPYEEPWMDRVDTLKQMQGWGDTSITHFRDMGVYGEQILLSVRYGNWSVVNDPQQAANWARYWRPEIQRYTHAYRSATGVDLTERVDTTTPGFLLQRRLATRPGKRRA